MSTLKATVRSVYSWESSTVNPSCHYWSRSSSIDWLIRWSHISQRQPNRSQIYLCRCCRLSRTQTSPAHLHGVTFNSSHIPWRTHVLAITLNRLRIFESRSLCSCSLCQPWTHPPRFPKPPTAQCHTMPTLCSCSFGTVALTVDFISFTPHLPQTQRGQGGSTPPLLSFNITGNDDRRAERRRCRLSFTVPLFSNMPDMGRQWRSLPSWHWLRRQGCLGGRDGFLVECTILSVVYSLVHLCHWH